MKKIIIAIDGFSSSGKSTMARQLAKEIGYVYVDSGAMYRAATLFAIERGFISNDHKVQIDRLISALPEMEITFSPVCGDGKQHTLLNGRDVEDKIRGIEVSNLVSPIAAIPEVRHRLTSIQQNYGLNKGIVMDGRDIGTTVFPQAEIKVFVDASAEERARRRVQELHEKGENVSYQKVLENIQQRDHIDSTRKESPLRKADDAFVLNNDKLTREEQLNILVELFQKRIQKIENRD